MLFPVTHGKKCIAIPGGKLRWGSLADFFDYKIYLEADLEVQNRCPGVLGIEEPTAKEKVPKLTPAVVAQKDIMAGGSLNISASWVVKYT